MIAAGHANIAGSGKKCTVRAAVITYVNMIPTNVRAGMFAVMLENRSSKALF